MGVDVPFQPSDERGLVPRLPELVNCVTVGVMEVGAGVVISWPILVDDKSAGKPESDPPTTGELADVEEGRFELSPGITNDEVSLVREELRVEDLLAVLLLELDDRVLDVELSDDVTLTNTGGVGIVGLIGLVIVIIESGIEVLDSGSDVSIELTAEENEDGDEDGTTIRLVRERVNVSGEFV
jgi:hypothetical protein